MNVRVGERAEIEAIPEIKAQLDRARAALDGRGRLVVRYSGTEPLLLSGVLWICKCFAFAFLCAQHDHRLGGGSPLGSWSQRPE